ncbi:MAG: LysR family transcriptional regulator [Pseudomonadota bacterium]
MNLLDMDLNLLRTLDVLIEERQVSRTALRLGVSQPAISHALGRLRRHFGDPLLVRQGQEMVLTPRAAELAGPLRQVLTAVRQLTGPARFDPARAEGRLRIATTDFGLAIVMPHVLAGLASQAPGLSIAYSHISGEMFEQLETGFLDLCLTGQASCRELQVEVLFQERFVLATRADHPLVGAPVTVQRFIAWPHVLVDVVHSRLHGIDERLAALSLQRHIALRMPSFLAAAFFARDSDLIVPIPERIAALHAKSMGLAILQPPPELDLGAYDYVQAWHPRRNDDPLHQWLRQLVRQGGAQIRAAG